MSTRFLVGPMLLLAWQVVPLTTVQDSGGKYRLTLVGGTSQLEYRTMNCAGDVVTATPQTVRFGAYEFEAWPAEAIRFVVSGTVLHSAAGTRLRVVRSSYPFDGAPVAETPGVTTTVVGGLVALEGGTVGVGFGLSTMGNWYGVLHGEATSSTVIPAFYLRLGSRDGMQFRFDALTPGPYLPVSGIARTGVAWGRGPQRRFGGFMGVGIGPQADLSYSLGPVLELTLPLAGRFDAMMAGGYRPSYTFADWGAAVGGRISLAR